MLIMALARLCRYQAALSNIKETALNEYAATHITKTLANSNHQATIKH